MKKNTLYLKVLSFLLGIFSLFLFGLFISKANISKSLKESTFTRWDSIKRMDQNRSIAAENPISCEFDDENILSLKDEIQQIESSFEIGHKLSGNVYGLDLNKIPYIQAQFIIENKHYIGDQAKTLNNSKCEDLPCLLTKIYGDEERALLSYYWYLKSGSVLSTANIIPGQKSSKPGSYNEKEYSHAHYLFSTEELKKFYLLAKSLPINFLNIPLLKSIHKVPGTQFEFSANNKVCSKTTSSGAILLTSDCLNNSAPDFLLKMTSQIANFLDKEEHFSSSKKWMGSSLWQERSYLDIKTKKYTRFWKSLLSQDNFVSSKAMKSPSDHLTELLAHYRYNSKMYSLKTPADLQKIISSKFFNNIKYDDLGLYKQYVEYTKSQWSKQELPIWKECINSHIPRGENLDFIARDLANKTNSPLFACINKKVPQFVNQLVSSIRRKSYEGCKFFDNNIEYSHLSQKFFSTTESFLQEKILKRKIEMQNHGKEVLKAQELKAEFIANIDPVKVYIQCYTEQNQESCFNKTIANESLKVLGKNKNLFSQHYYKIMTKEFESIFSFDEYKLKAHALSKRFLTPLYVKMSSAAQNIWNICKNEPEPPMNILKLPMTFTGGRHFVSLALINCVNTKIENGVLDSSDFKLSKEVNGKIVEFKLSQREKIFAQKFINKKLANIFSSILEREIKKERQLHASYFSQKEGSIVKEIINDKDFTDEVYSFEQISQECVERVSDFYPKRYYTTTKRHLDKLYGKKICQSILSHEKVSSKINQRIRENWKKNKDIAATLLKKYFSNYSRSCESKYVQTHNLKVKCVQDSFKKALNKAISEWKKEDDYKFLTSKENDLGRELASLEPAVVAEKIQN